MQLQLIITVSCALNTCSCAECSPRISETGEGDKIKTRSVSPQVGARLASAAKRARCALPDVFWPHILRSYYNLSLAKPPNTNFYVHEAGSCVLVLRIVSRNIILSMLMSMSVFRQLVPLQTQCTQWVVHQSCLPLSTV